MAEFALVFTDESAPRFVHWVAYGIPAEARGLPGGIRYERAPKVPFELHQGRNGLGNVGYSGPAPPVGRPHHYRLHLLALDRPSDLEPGADEAELRAATTGHVLAEATLSAQHGRRRDLDEPEEVRPRRGAEKESKVSARPPKREPEPKAEVEVLERLGHEVLPRIRHARAPRT